MSTQRQLDDLLGEFKQGIQAVLGGKLHAGYIHGGAAVDDSLPTGDVDFHVILKEHLTDIEKKELDNLHKELARKYPPLGVGMDGYYITLEDARRRTPPRSEMWQCAIDNAWALHREHIRAGRYITLYGGDPREIYPPSDWHEIEEALLDELRYVKAHLDEYPDYCILNLCRLIYSFQTRNVVISKAEASEWAMDGIPEWRWLVELARKSYQKAATSHDRTIMLSEVGNFFEYANTQIDRVRQRDLNDSSKQN